MKNLLLLTAISLSAFTVSAANVTNAPSPEPANKKVVQTFHEVFKNAENVHWGTVNQLNEANFTTGAIKVTAIFDKKGNLVRTLRYYKENDLPANILFQIKKEYLSQEVWGVTEVSNEDGISYQIVLRDKAHWYHILANGEGEISLQSTTDRGDI